MLHLANWKASLYTPNCNGKGCFPICTFVTLSLWLCPVLQGLRCLHGRPACSLTGVCTLQWASLPWPRTEVRSSLNPKCCTQMNNFRRSHTLLLFPVPSQGLCREIHRWPPMAPPSLPLLCPHVSPQGHRCILEWAHISRTTRWAATSSRGDSMALKVLPQFARRFNTIFCLYFGLNVPLSCSKQQLVGSFCTFGSFSWGYSTWLASVR